MIVSSAQWADVVICWSISRVSSLPRLSLCLSLFLISWRQKRLTNKSRQWLYSTSFVTSIYTQRSLCPSFPLCWCSSLIQPQLTSYKNTSATTTYIRSGGARNVRGYTTYNCLYGDGRPKLWKGYLFQASGMKGVGMSLAEVYEVYERGGESVSVCKRPNRATRCISWLWKSRENALVLWLTHILKIMRTFTAGKRDVKF